MEKMGTPPEREATGTVGEDYSDNGNAWDYFTHDQAVSGISRGEDGLAGISDDYQVLCFALAFWNGQRIPSLAHHAGRHPAHSTRAVIGVCAAYGLSAMLRTGHLGVEWIGHISLRGLARRC
jgi:hypothetical protein